MEWCSHVEILFTRGNSHIRYWRVIIGISTIVFLILVFHAHTHPFFEINFGLLVRFLSILQFFVTPINEMITSSNMVVSIVLYTFGSVLTIKIELLYDLIKKFLLNRHFLFAREQSLISVFVFDLQ